MKLQIYDNSLKNWRRRAAEYRQICRKGPRRNNFLEMAVVSQ